MSRVKEYLKRKRLEYKIISCYRNTENKEILEIIHYIKKHGITYFNYEWFNTNSVDVDVYYDESVSRYYVYYNEYKMYMKAGWDIQKCKDYCSFLFLEQSIESPHRYLDDKIEKGKFNIVIDGGGAEGSFALSIIDKLEKIFILECDEEWIDSLKITFEPWKDKVIIVNKFLSDVNSEKYVTIDSLIKEESTVDLIKLDVEGDELKALNGCCETIKKNYNLIFLICAYHYQMEEEEIRDFFQGRGWLIENRKGFIYFLHDENQMFPFFRRGVLKVYKIDN